MNTSIRRLFAAIGPVLLLSACVGVPTPEDARTDAAAALQLGHAEDRFNLAMREFAQRQIEQDESLKPHYGAIDNFWREQVRWPDVRDRLIDDYTKLYKPEELRAIRRTLENPQGDLIIGYADVFNHALAQQTLGAVQEKMPALRQRLQALQKSSAAAQDGDTAQDLRARAEAGDPAAQLHLAEQLMARDLPQALQWLEKSAAQDHAPAQDMLASLYYRGIGVPRDYRRARELFEKAVARSYLPSMNNLAWLLATCPDASLRDGKRAVQLLEPVMDQSVQMLDTLAAAHAETGNFAQAISLQRRAIAAIGQTRDPRMASALDRLQAYAARQTWRDPATP